MNAVSTYGEAIDRTGRPLERIARFAFTDIERKVMLERKIVRLRARMAKLDMGLVRIADETEAMFEQLPQLDLGLLTTYTPDELASIDAMLDRTRAMVRDTLAIINDPTMSEAAPKGTRRNREVIQRILGSVREQQQAIRDLLDDPGYASEYVMESPETRARLDAACRPFDETRQPVSMSLDELFGHA